MPPCFTVIWASKADSMPFEGGNCSQKILRGQGRRIRSIPRTMLWPCLRTRAAEQMNDEPQISKRRPLAPSGGNDCIHTPDDLAVQIVAHFMPSGRILEPCRGGGAFTRAMPGCDWCEIQEGKNFLLVSGHWDWIVTNPPWSKFRIFLLQSMLVADNIVFLCLVNAWFMKAPQEDIKAGGFGLVEICYVPTPPPPWPQVGFCLGAGWLRRGWQGSTAFSKLKVAMVAHARRRNSASEQAG